MQLCPPPPACAHLGLPFAVTAGICRSAVIPFDTPVSGMGLCRFACAEFFHISYWYLSCNTIDNRQLTNPHNKSRAGQGFGSLLAPSQMGRSPINCQAFTGGAWCSLVSFPNPLESEVESLPRCSPPPHPLPVGRANGSVGAGSCHPPTAHFWGRSPV